MTTTRPDEFFPVFLILCNIHNKNESNRTNYHTRSNLLLIALVILQILWMLHTAVRHDRSFCMQFGRLARLNPNSSCYQLRCRAACSTTNCNVFGPSFLYESTDYQSKTPSKISIQNTKISVPLVNRIKFNFIINTS